MGRGRQGAAADPPRSADARHSDVRARPSSCSSTATRSTSTSATWRGGRGPGRHDREPSNSWPCSRARPTSTSWRRRYRMPARTRSDRPGDGARRARRPSGIRPATCAPAGRPRCRFSSTATTPTPPRPSWATSRACCGRPKRSGRTGPGDPGQRRAARLVQPGTAQHGVPRAGSHRLHLDDHGRRLDGAVDRAREGARHDRADSHGAHLDARRSSSARRSRIWCSRRSARWPSSWRRWCSSTCPCAETGWNWRWWWPSSWSAPGHGHARVDPRGDSRTWRFSWPCSWRCCPR